MKTTRLQIFMGDDTLTTFVGKKENRREVPVYDKVELDRLAADRSGTTVGGTLAVTVARVTGKRSRGEIKDGYMLEGNCLVVEDGDDTVEVNKQLALECGVIGAVREDDDATDETESGSPVTLAYVVNHNGLRLVYNKAIRNVFRVRQGRQSVAQAIDRFAARLQLALNWAVAEKRLDLIADQEKCIAAYEASLK